MSQKKTTSRRSWAAIKRARADSKERREAYREAEEAFALAERVRDAREFRGITQAELSARIGSEHPAIARLAGGGGITPSFDSVRRIAAVLGLELVTELRARRAA